jgi:hypothetical protein
MSMSTSALVPAVAATAGRWRSCAELAVLVGVAMTPS